MRRDLLIKSGNLASTSDFRVLAPIKKGFVPSNEAVTYKTRVKRVLRTTHAGRSGAFEYELARVLSDSVERVGVIHSVGIAVLEPEDKVILTVTFDGAWEAYIRIIWQKATRLLDLVFCNCEGYPLGYESTYEQWGIWLKQAQSEAYFLYATPTLTVDDTRYLGMEERVYRREAGASAESRVTHIRIPSAEQIARQSLFGTGGPIGTDPTNAGLGHPLTKQAAGLQPFRHGVRSLVGLYRLADLYPPGTPDGDILHRAAQELLPEFREMLGDGVYQTGIVRALKRFEEAVLWMLRPPSAEPPARQDLPLEPPATQSPKDAGNVQGGILSKYPDNIGHGCLLLIAFESRAAVAALLSVLPFTSEADKDKPQTAQITTNIAFTIEGLRAAGLTDDEVRELPEEFVQGMERRAGLLGDLRFNHPRHWRLPPLNWHLGENAEDLAEGDETPRIDFSAVHAVVQVRLLSSSSGAAASKAQLMAALRKLITDSNELMVDGKKVIDYGKGVKPLSLQWMQRQRNNGKVVEHFGFRDGASNPVLNKSEAGERYSNHVNLGEILCGHPNMADKSGGHAKAPKLIQDLLQDGSFLAVRKLRQDVEALDAALNDALQQPEVAALGLSRSYLMAKMMGRWPDDGTAQAGEPMATVLSTKPETNDFHFDGDRDGAKCPFHAHIRRANPRERNPEPGSRPPRLVRRGMSYGPSRSAGPDKERGLIFMAYNASLGEQYELVQRWLNGGNSSGSYSGQSDPIFGLAEPGRRRHFRFEHQDANTNKNTTVRVALDGSDRLHDEPRPFVRVEWGVYLFAPSRSALALLKARAEAKYDTRPVTWSAETGDLRIADLREIEKNHGAQAAIAAWKSALEDPDAATDFTSASIWAAIRECHGGVLRTPYGVLVADRDMVQEVFADSQRLSIEGYLPRMRRSFGILYLGRDPGDDYDRESKVCNKAIMDLDPHLSFTHARNSVNRTLGELVEQAKKDAKEDGQTSWDLTIDARELIDPLLADFCEEWFGLTDKEGYFRRAGYRWDWKRGIPPNYPGHFLSPSRYIFQPHPGPTVEKFGADHGDSVQTAMRGFLNRFGATITAPVTRAVLDSPMGKADLPFVARTVAGAMMGFIPTVEGSLRRILNEWLRDGNLWSLRARFDGTRAKDYTEACNRLGGDFIPAMQLRAVPELIWRTAAVAHTLGAAPHQVDVQPGDIVVAGAVSATQQSLQERSSDVYHAFGGNRWDPDHPTHACPGAHPALAVMIGFFSALVESRLRLRVGPGPLTLALDGRLPPPTEEFKKSVRGTISAGMNGDRKLDADTAAKLKVAAKPLLAIGDSWLFDQWERDFGVSRPNLIRSLLPLGYKDSASGIKDFAYAGRTLSDMAQRQFLTSAKNYIADEPGLKAILLSGGGNDVVSGLPRNQPLYRMLQPRSAGAPELNEAEVLAFIDGTLAGYYKTILDTLTASTTIPILIHGYDHPIPDGRGDTILTVEIGPWILPIFLQRGYNLVPPELADLAPARDATRRLIDRFNAMIARVAAAYRNVHHVDLTGTLAKAYGNNHLTHWNNELHPKENGFDLLAKLIEAKLKSLKI